MPEKDYLAIAKQRVSRPSQAKSWRRLLVYSRNKKGKTTFCLSAPSVLILDPEHGTDLYTKADPIRWPIERWDDLAEAYGALRTGKLTPRMLQQGESSTPFEWVGVDGVTKMNNLALRHVMKTAEERDLSRIPGIVDRRDYGKSGELMKDMLNQFHGLKMHVCYTAQERMITDNASGLPDEDSDATEADAYYVPDLPAGPRSAMNAIVEVIARLYTVKTEVKLKGGGTDMRTKRRLWIGPHEKYDTGYRSDFDLPDYIQDPTIPKLVKLMTGEGS